VRPPLQSLETERNQTPLDSSFAILHSDHKNNRLYSILKKVCFLGAVIHILFIFFFLSIGSLWLSVLNVFSVIIWLIAMYQNQSGRYILATLIASIETIVHAALATHFLGLSMGFHYFLWPVALLIMVSNLFSTKKSMFMGFSVIVLYGVLNVYAKDITYQYAFPAITDFMLLTNTALAALGFVVVMMSSQDNNTKNEKRLYEIANKDGLTGAFNRQFVYQLMKQTFSERRNLKSLDYTLVLTDIDNFKEINESVGHVVGDEVIKAVSAYLVTAVRETDIVARWGGEQFLIILMNIEPDNSQLLIEKIRKNVRYQIITEGLSDRLTTLSFGVAKAKDDEKFEDTIKRADLSMYKAKKLGKDRIINAQ
jgi:diguanylate cyclase (GGDEF)-like protein